MAGKRLELDITEIERLAGLGLSQAEICLAVGISEDTLTRRKQDTADVAEAIKRGKARTKRTVANALMSRITDGDLGAIIWYEKTRLGYSDRLQVNPPPIDWDRVPNEMQQAFADGKLSLADVLAFLSRTTGA